MSNKSKCDFCGKEYFNLYKCRFCDKELCPDHRLRENHNCTSLGKETGFNKFKKHDKTGNTADFKDVNNKYSKRHTKNIIKKIYGDWWLIFWFFIYGVLYYLSTIIIRLLDTSNYYLNIIILGTIISVFTRAIHCTIKGYKFKLNFNLFIWTLIYILLLFFIKGVLFLYFKNIFYEMFVVAIIYLILVYLLKKIDFEILKYFVIIVVILFIVSVFVRVIHSGENDTLNYYSNITSKKISNITESTTSKVSNTINSMVSEPANSIELETAIFKYTNEERNKAGIVELKLDSDLSAVARAHSENMVKMDFFSHTNLKGEDPTARAIRMGYNVHKELGGGWYSDGIAENIGKMPIVETINIFYPINYALVDADEIAKKQVDSWMNSVGHRANILNSQYSVIGVGVAYDGRLYYISTQNFK
jgi:uncharacterized protein YkwD